MAIIKVVALAMLATQLHAVGVSVSEYYDEVYKLDINGPGEVIPWFLTPPPAGGTGAPRMNVRWVNMHMLSN